MSRTSPHIRRDKIKREYQKLLEDCDNALTALKTAPSDAPTNIALYYEAARNAIVEADRFRRDTSNWEMLGYNPAGFNETLKNWDAVTEPLCHYAMEFCLFAIEQLEGRPDSVLRRRSDHGLKIFTQEVFIRWQYARSRQQDFALFTCFYDHRDVFRDATQQRAIEHGMKHKAKTVFKHAIIENRDDVMAKMLLTFPSFKGAWDAFETPLNRSVYKEIPFSLEQRLNIFTLMLNETHGVPVNRDIAAQRALESLYYLIKNESQSTKDQFYLYIANTLAKTSDSALPDFLYTFAVAKKKEIVDALTAYGSIKSYDQFDRLLLPSQSLYTVLAKPRGDSMPSIDGGTSQLRRLYQKIAAENPDTAKLIAQSIANTHAVSPASAGTGAGGGGGGGGGEPAREDYVSSQRVWHKHSSRDKPKPGDEAGHESELVDMGKLGRERGLNL